MSAGPKQIPSSSQTVGPYFRIGLEYLIDRIAEAVPRTERAIEIQGRILDRDGVGVPDAMLEFWCAGNDDNDPANVPQHGIPTHFRRVATDADGSFKVTLAMPAAPAFDDKSSQAPHAMVLVYARGLQRHLITRVYVQDETLNQTDPVLQAVPADRRETLIARRTGERLFRWDVILQGVNETVFFAW